MKDEPLSPEIRQFVEAAQHYCAEIEAAHAYFLTERLVRIAAVLAPLYAASLYLPFEEKPLDRDEPPVPPEVESWPAFGEMTMFWQVPDAYEWSAPVVASLSEQLLGIYRDVKRGLLILERGSTGPMSAVAEAAWEWRVQMEQHWGAQAVDALRAMHRAIQRLSS